jgi:large subunit ribosomal protein L15
MRRIPKRGFHNPTSKEYALVNLGQLEVFEGGVEITPERLHAQGLVRRQGSLIKILADGVLTKALTVKAHGFSAKAIEKINALGGKAEVITHA